MSGALGAFEAAGVLHPAEVAFARMLARRATGESDEALQLAAALACRAPRAGHVCVELHRAAEALGAPRVEGEGEGDPILPWPEPAEWRTRVAASSAVGDGSVPTPLVLVEDRLYLHRYWRYEQRLASALRDRYEASPPDLDIERLALDLKALFPNAAEEVDYQAIAAATAVLGRFAVISGGPGTGKTTTLKRIVCLVARQLEQLTPGVRPRILLMAPTGKAATRMRDAMRPAGADDPTRLPPAYGDILATVAPEESTIHRGLGVKGGNLARFWRSADDPLVADVVIVDESSMVDIALMTKLVEAVPSTARLILVGDRHQLASVEVGSVLGDMCEAGLEQGRSVARQEALGALGLRLPPTPGSPSPGLGDAMVSLERNYRFERQAGIRELASAINGGEPERALEVLADDARYPEVRWVAPQGASGLDDVRDAVVASYRPVVEAALAGDADGALDALDRFRLLCAHRRGRLGVDQANQTVCAWLEEAIERFAPRGQSYAGRPLIVTENDYGVSLFNGDVGVLVKDEGVRAWFRGDGEATREPLAPSRLPSHDTVFATTIHKSQGSQYEHVVVALPEKASAICTRELLYTAVTRAANSVTIVATREAIEMAIVQRIQRHSGLRAALGA